MVKVSIKKNIKPKSTKQKQKQSQKTNITVNISSDVIKKKRGRPAKRSTIEKKPAQQQPITQSYNQPIFKQSTPQPSSLTSSILASQNIPRVIKEEVKEESALKKALIEQNLSTAEDPIEKSNDLERVRNARIKKVDVVKEEPIRSALLGQLITEQGDDTEEIQQIIKLSKPTITAFQPFNEDELTPLKTTRKEPIVNPLTSFSTPSEPIFLSPENKQTEFFTALDEQPFEPVKEEQPVIEDEGSQEEILTSNQQEPEPTILEPVKEVKSLVSLQAEEPVRQADQYTTEQLVKDEIPIAEASLLSVMRSKQIESKWKELHKKGGPLEDIVGGSRRISDILLDEINSVEPSWAPTPTGKRPGKVPTARPVSILEESVKKKRGRPPKRNDLVEDV